ncbi:hypothetical protein AAZV13_04G122900 [Glycine max]
MSLHPQMSPMRPFICLSSTEATLHEVSSKLRDLWEKSFESLGRVPQNLVLSLFVLAHLRLWVCVPFQPLTKVVLSLFMLMHSRLWGYVSLRPPVDLVLSFFRLTT